MTERAETCDNCRWFARGPDHEDGSQNGDGKCHRYPPSLPWPWPPGQHEREPMAIQVDVTWEDWCGEWKPLA